MKSSGFANKVDRKAAMGYLERERCPYCKNGPNFCNGYELRESPGGWKYICNGYRTRLWDERMW